MSSLYFGMKKLGLVGNRVFSINDVQNRMIYESKTIIRGQNIMSRDLFIFKVLPVDIFEATITNDVATKEVLKSKCRFTPELP